MELTMNLALPLFFTACASPVGLKGTDSGSPDASGGADAADHDTDTDSDDPPPAVSDDDDGGESSGPDDTDDPGDPGDGDTDTSTPADPESEDDARMLSVVFPSEINCGEAAEGLVVVENTGISTWTRADEFKLGAVGDDDPLLDSDDVRVWLDDDVVVAPGQIHEFEIDLIGPGTTGPARTDWQMVREGVHWFGEVVHADVTVVCEDPTEDTEYPLPLPDMSSVVNEIAADYPGLLTDSCLDDGGTWDFLDLLVDRLREIDTRWGYNWKRGVEGDPSEDVVDYHYGPGVSEGSTDVYIIDVIIGHCGGAPAPGWTDQTEATADAGTIGIWTGRGRF
jgi:hypothetical protein